MLFGASIGNLEDFSHTSTSKQQEQAISTLASIFPSPRVLRSGLKASAAALPSAFSQSSHDYDQLLYMEAKYGFTPILNFHTNSASGTYFIPGNATYGGTGTTMQNWEDWVTSCLNRYASGGSFSSSTSVSVYGASTTFATDGLTWTPPTYFEIWNEPNSPTGNAGDVSGSTGGMNAADCYNILLRASRAIRTHANTHSWTPYIVGLGLANTMGGMKGYWQTIVDYGTASGSSYTIGAGPLAGVYGPNPHDFVNALGIHPYSSADPNDSTGGTGVNPIKTTIANLRTYMDVNGGLNKPLFITEWGWKGHNGSNRYNGGPSNTEWEGIADQGAGQASQEGWEMGAIDVIEATTSWHIDGACHFAGSSTRPWDDASIVAPTANDVAFLAPYYNLLAGTSAGPIPDSSLKAVALAYRAKLALPPASSVEQHVNVLKRSSGIRFVV